jgi:hypothetical protein
MAKRWFSGLGLVFALSLLLFTPWAYPQEVKDSKPVEKTATATGKGERKFIVDPCKSTACVNKVLYFSNLSQPTELQDAINTIRTLLEANRITQLPSVRVVAMRGTPEQVAEAEKLAAEIDSAKRRFGTGYRLDFTLSELQGGRKLSSKTYSLITATRDTAKLNMGSKLLAPPQGEGESDGKPAETQQAGQRIECRVVSESESSVVLHLSAHLLKAGARSRGNRAAAEFRVEGTFTLELGKTTVVNSLDDPDSDRKYQVEVTATRIEDKQ